MATQWYVKIKGKRGGPLSGRQLKGLADRGQISPEDLVRQEAGGPWVPAGRVKGLFSETPAAVARPEAPSTPVAKRLEEPSEQTESPAESEPVSQQAAAEKGPPSSEAAGSGAETSAAASEPPPIPPQPPAFPEPSEVEPSAAALSLGEFHVVGDSPTDRVLGRGARAAWWNSKAAVGATAGLMLIAVSVVGAVLMLSGGDAEQAAPAAPEQVAAEPASTVEPEAKPGAGAPSEAAAATSEPEQWDLGIEGLEGLEELGIVVSSKSESDSADREKKPEPAKPEVREPEPAKAEPGKQIAEARLPDRPGGAQAERADKPAGSRSRAGQASAGKAKKPEEDPDGDISKITADIEALGGGDQSDEEYDFEEILEKDQKKPQAKRGSSQRRGGGKGKNPRQGGGSQQKQKAGQRQPNR